MVFSNTTDKNGLIQHVEFLTQLGDGAVSGNSTLLKQVTALINRYYQRAVVAILEAQDEWDFDDRNLTDYPIATTPLAADQRDYTFPASLTILKIKRVDVTWDGTNYYQARPIDTTEIDFGIGNDSLTDGKFTTTAPRYDMIGNAIRLYPRATSAQVSAGAKLRIEFFREVDEFTSADTTQEPGIDEPFHPYLSIGASYEYCLANDLSRANSLAKLLADYDMRMKAYYSRKQLDRPLALTPEYISYS